ncbi:hypothetical protein OG216_46850 (plasmid) [Streptomycetaceae bacterium NBC_01309]
MNAAEANRRRNRARHWNGRVASAQTDRDRAGVWYDASRTVAAQAERDGRPEVWADLVQTLHDFFQRHAK